MNSLRVFSLVASIALLQMALVAPLSQAQTASPSAGPSASQAAMQSNDSNEIGSPAGNTQLSGPQRRLRLRQFMEQRQRNGMPGLGSPGQAGRRSPGRGAGQAVVIDPSKVSVRKDIAYGTELRQKLDVYSPANSGKAARKAPLPVLFFVHGGGWQIGNKNMHAAKGVAFAENGVIFVSTNYRLAPESMHPKHIQDVAAAFAWVKTHAGEIGADPSRMYVMGHSAGAHLVDLLGTNEKYLHEQGMNLGDIKGVISLDTASLDLSERLSDNSPEGGAVGGMIKNAFGNDPEVLADASPRAAIHAGKKYPLFLMFCGERRATCVAQHRKFAEAMGKVGGKVDVEVVPLSHSAISQAAGQQNSEIFAKSLALVKGQ